MYMFTRRTKQGILIFLSYIFSSDISLGLHSYFLSGKHRKPVGIWEGKKKNWRYHAVSVEWLKEVGQSADKMAGYWHCALLGQAATCVGPFPPINVNSHPRLAAILGQKITGGLFTDCHNHTCVYYMYHLKKNKCTHPYPLLKIDFRHCKATQSVDKITTKLSATNRVNYQWAVVLANI